MSGASESYRPTRVEVDTAAFSRNIDATVRRLPNRSRLISVTRDGRAEIAIGETQLAPGDLVMAILEPDVEDELKQQLMPA